MGFSPWEKFGCGKCLRTTLMNEKGPDLFSNRWRKVECPTIPSLHQQRLRRNKDKGLFLCLVTPSSSLPMFLFFFIIPRMNYMIHFTWGYGDMLPLKLWSWSIHFPRGFLSQILKSEKNFHIWFWFKKNSLWFWPGKILEFEDFLVRPFLRRIWKILPSENLCTDGTK